MSLLDDLLTTAIKNSYKKNKRKQSEPSILGALQDPQFRNDVKQGLFDAANRGGVAGLLGGPVDLATMALRPLGYNVDKPVGGSEWIGQQLQDAGMVTGNRNPVAEALASVLVPGAMAKAGKALFPIEQAAIQNANIAGPVSSSPFATQRGVFGGLNAKTADKAKLSQAEQMLSKGIDPAQVWKETGWGRGPDGKWRFEISDDAAKLTDAAAERFTPGTINTFGKKHIGNIPATLDHPSLIDNYPQWMKDIEVRESPMLEGGSFMDSEHFLDPSRRVGIMNVSQSGANPKSTMLHELQHAIQQREGFARGGSPENYNQQDIAEKARDLLSWRKDVEAQIAKNPGMDWAKAEQAAIKEYKDIGWPEGIPSDEVRRMAVNPSEYFDSPPQEFVSLYGLDKRTTPYSGNDLYKRLGGEAEARLVQSRMNLTPEERAAQYPWNADYFKQQTGVGLDDLIHRFDGGQVSGLLR